MNAQSFHSQPKPLPTLNRLRSLLSYDPETGQFVWIVTRHGRSAGSIAGTRRHGDDRNVVTVDGVEYRAARLAWLMHYGSEPTVFIDHINNDASDDRIENLREASQAQNMRNSRLMSRSTSGLKGVSFHKKEGRWRATIFIESRHRHLGYFDTPEAAHVAYAEAARKHYGEFAKVA